MKLYDGGRAPNPRRVAVFLAEKGIEIERVAVDMGALGHKGPDVTALNPMQQLPVLVLDDGQVLTESIAICRYLDELYPEPPLFGVDPFDRAVVEMWNRRVELNFLAAVGAAFRHTHPAMATWEVPQIAVWGEANRPKALKFLEMIDGELSGRRFVAGPRYTVADITLLIGIQFMKPAKIERPAHLAHLARWFDEVMARPGATP